MAATPEVAVPARSGVLRRALGLHPVPVPPHVFEVDGRSVRYGRFERGGAGLEVARWREAGLPADCFQPGPLGGPLRSPEAFASALGTLLEDDEAVTAASLVVPDRWLRVLFTELEPELGGVPGEDVLRFKLKKMVPFRVEELRLRATVAPELPGKEGQRLLLAFAVEQLLADLESTFAARGVRIGQTASRSLYLASLLRERGDASTLVINLESDGYSLTFVRGGLPLVARYRAASFDPGDAAQIAHVAQDLGILLSFLREHWPDDALQAVVAGEPEAARRWVELLEQRFEISGRVITAADLGAAADVRVPWHYAAPLAAAATREVA